FSPFSFVYSLGHPRDPHPFPTRRSSDLRRAATPGAERAEGAQRRNLAAPPSPARPFLDGPRIGGPSLSLIEALASTLSRRRFRGVPVGALVDEPSGDGLCWTLSSNAPPRETQNSTMGSSSSRSPQAMIVSRSSSERCTLTW